MIEIDPRKSRDMIIPFIRVLKPLSLSINRRAKNKRT
jgi:hypothetical protein